MRCFRIWALSTAIVAVFFTLSGSAAAGVECAPRPSTPDGSWVHAVRADQAATPRSAGSIAVLDTGVADVPELRGRVRPGFNVVNGTQNTADIDGHGTAVAAIAAGAPGGVRGIAPTTQIIPIKIFDDRGESTPEDFIAGIERAVAAGATVINVSAEGVASDVEPAVAREVRNAIFAAVSLGIPVVAPAGNEGASSLAVPAAYPHVISVGATDDAGGRAPFSNLGSGLDLVAPGTGLVTAAPTVLCASGFGTFTGTSFSAPMVAGAAAMLLASHPDLDGLQLADMLRLHGVRSRAPEWSPELGFGQLDVMAAMNAPVPSPDRPEVNDDIGWAKLQPAALTAPTRSNNFFARLAPHLDPADVYRLRLRKNDRLKVRLQQPAGTRLRLSFGARSLARKPGTSFTRKIAKTGTYYVGVTLQRSPAAGTGYALSLKR